ncbi:MAG: restriction endonuclease subunit S [Candidatus Nitrotoga sp.]|nr:restriction endonuclease subunit S [Candidatus Nitrotoga sp.]MDP1856492.1 restriction endonuclease subunit S [Candidatus Nitrotoga sp.]
MGKSDEPFLKDTNTHQYLASQSSGSANQANISKSDIENIPFSQPPKNEQKNIAAVLSSLDDKIDLLHRQNQTLEAIATTLFRQWFVEEAQENWREVRLVDYFPVVTGKKDANFSTDGGEYPFFTCSQSAIKAPSYSFEGAAILLSGNGDFNVKRYTGKFEAYQRTYVLIPYDVKYFSFLYTLMKFYLLEITGGYQGSVINFITKGMITEFKFRLPDEHINIDEKLAQFNKLYEKIDSNNSQIQTLEKLRDTLLPKLMSGEVRVAV